MLQDYNVFHVMLTMYTNASSPGLRHAMVLLSLVTYLIDQGDPVV